MTSFGLSRLFVSVLLFVSVGFASPITPQHVAVTNSSSPSSAAGQASTSSWWLANIQHQGVAPYASSGYEVFRNVVDFGADPSGNTDSTAAINSAISTGPGRCGQGCGSSTTTPALVYFPPGTYLISGAIIQYYYTQLVGDAVSPPTIKAASSFQGVTGINALIDSDPYDDGNNWYVNQNNFYRQVRNFVLDMTAISGTTAVSGVHWQVAQATSLQNIVFNMYQGTDSAHVGVFMDNGSGGFFTDLTFNGGKYGTFMGSQQFTSKSLTFNNVQTAMFMNWNWGWTIADVTVNSCGIALDISNSPSNQTVGSVSFLDSTVSNTPIGVKTAFSVNPESVPDAGGSLIIDNVDFTSCASAVVNTDGATILAGNTVVQSWGQGNHYTSSTGTRVQQSLTPPSKASGLLNSEGKYFVQSKPQYTNIAASSFVSIRTLGAKGDGKTDDTAVFQSAMSSVTSDQVLFIDYGAYVLSDTITIPANFKIVGEHWPVIFCTGSKFSDQSNPVPFWQVGTAGESGSVQMQDLVFETMGPAPGAIMMEWNLASSQGASGLWDVHWRIGGSAGTLMQSNTCEKNPSVTHGANSACVGAFLLFYATPSSSGVYLENNWLWVADHELDISPYDQIDIYNGRGMLIESKGPSWYWGGAVEHSQLYNYQINNAENVFMGFIQSETPYMQSNPNALAAFTPNSAWNDPTFSTCAAGQNCIKSWGLRVLSSSNVYIYGTGLYSFFENYSQSCVYPNDCQENIIDIESSSAVWLYTMSTKASVNMLTLNGQAAVLDEDNRSNFCGTVVGWSF